MYTVIYFSSICGFPQLYIFRLNSDSQIIIIRVSHNNYGSDIRMVIDKYVLDVFCVSILVDL